MKKLRVLQVVHSFPPAIGGVENHAFNLSRELAEKCEVKVVTTSAKGAPAKERRWGVWVERKWALAFPGFSSVKIVPLLCLRLLGENADVFCSHGYGSLMPLYTGIAALLKGKPFVFTLHGYPKQKGLAGVFQLVYRLFAASIYLRIAKKIISVTDANLRDIEGEVDMRKVSVIPNGVDEKRFRCEKSIDALSEDIVLYVGRLDRDKEVDVLVRAVAGIKPKFRNIKLRIVGNDEGERKGLEELAKGLGVEAEFAECSYGEVVKEYEKASIVVLPSRYEGLSLVLLEAIACERPMLSTKVGAAPKLFSEVYGKSAGEFLFSSEGELAEKIGRVLGNRKRFASIAKVARVRLVAKYSWKKVAEETLDVYKEAVRERMGEGSA